MFLYIMIGCFKSDTLAILMYNKFFKGEKNNSYNIIDELEFIRRSSIVMLSPLV